MPKGDFILVLSGILILGAVAAGIVLAAFLQRRTRHRRASFDGSCAAAARWLHLATRTPSFARGETVVERRPVAVELQRGTMEHPTFVRVWTPIDVQSPARGAYRRPSSKPVMTAATTVLRRKTRTDRLGDRLDRRRQLPQLAVYFGIEVDPLGHTHDGIVLGEPRQGHFHGIDATDLLEVCGEYDRASRP